MDAVLGLGRHGELGPMGAVKALPGHQAVEVVAALLVASRAEGDSADSAGLHGVIMLFMSLDVLSVLDSTMFVVVDLETSNNGPGTEGLGHTKLVWESIDPKHTLENHFDEHSGGGSVQTESCCRYNVSAPW